MTLFLPRGIIGLLRRGEADEPTSPTRRRAPDAGATIRRGAAACDDRSGSRQDPLSRELTVSFDGFKALNALTLYVEPGELRCIIGPNGAGKTTMMDVITGKTRPDPARPGSAATIDLLEA